MGGGVYTGPDLLSGRPLSLVGGPDKERSEEVPVAVQAPTASAAAAHHVIVRLCRAPARPFPKITCVLGYSP